MILLLLALSTAVSQEETDIVIVVDSSNSMLRNDPAGRRTRLAQSAVDFESTLGPARFSVIQFAGWNESAPREIVPVLRESAIAKVAEALEKLPPFGEASDINVAFERGLPKVMEERRKAAAKGPVWVIVLTDGEFDVVEERIRPEYEARARSDYPREYQSERDMALLKAAMRHFAEGVRSRFRDEPIFVSGVNMGPAGPGEAFQTVISSGSRVGKIVNGRGSPLFEALGPLLADGPRYRPGKDLFYGYEAREAATWSKRIRVYPGSLDVRFLVWSESRDYNVSAAGLETRKTGSGSILSAAQPKPGTYALESASGAPGKMEVLLFFRSSLDTRLTVASDSSGSSILAEIRLVDETGEPVLDAELAQLMRGEARIIAPRGDAVAIPLRFETIGSAKVSHAVPDDAFAGEYRIEARVALEFPGGLPGMRLLGEPKAASLKIVPAFEASFASAEAWMGQDVAIRMRPVARMPSDARPIELTLRGEGNPAVHMAHDSASGEWRGSFRPGIAGKWSLPAGVNEVFALKPASPAAVDVKGRSLRLYQDGKPAEQVVADVRYMEKGEYPLDLSFEVDAQVGERPEYKTKFDGFKDVSLDVGEGRRAVLKIDAVDAIPEEAGGLEVSARVAGQHVARRFPIQFRYIDKSAKVFQRMLPWLVAAVLMILAAAWWSLLARFADRQLRPVVGLEIGAPYFLRAWSRGMAGRKAVGTPEAKDALRFRMSGLRGPGKGACSVTAARGGVIVSRNAQPVERPARLAHGDEIRVAADGKSQVYLYFERPPTEDELGKLHKDFEGQDSFYVEED